MNSPWHIVVAAMLLPSCIGRCADGIASYADSLVPPEFCVQRWASDLNEPRGMVVASNGDVLVVERGFSNPRVSVLWDDDGDGMSSVSERAILAEAEGLNHGIALCNGFLFASSDTQVYRWLYTEGARVPLSAPTIVVHNINADGNGGAPMGHKSRTLAFDSGGNLYISVGSMGNVDAGIFVELWF
jgi:glucose/arabinose dehydrogenase